jgi:glycerol-3-phosphate dehydrogenase
MAYHVVVIGAGSTGAATAHDLALRGFRVTVVERGEVASGTSGRNHCLLHSGGRYAMKDPESARECIAENMILRRIMPDALELNDGLFVALDEGDLSFKERFLAACEECGIPAREIPVRQALALEPHLNPGIRAAVQVPDGVFEPLRFCLSFLATARRNGATVLTYAEVVDMVFQGRTVAGVRVRDRRTGQQRTIGADVVINAAGPWAGRIAAMAGVDVPVVPTAGVMISVGRRWNRMVINRLNLPGTGTSSSPSGARPSSEPPPGRWKIPISSRSRRTTSACSWRAPNGSSPATPREGSGGSSRWPGPWWGGGGWPPTAASSPEPSSASTTRPTAWRAS